MLRSGMLRYYSGNHDFDGNHLQNTSIKMRMSEEGDMPLHTISRTKEYAHNYLKSGKH